jgi:hypothetical protein
MENKELVDLLINNIDKLSRKEKTKLKKALGSDAFSKYQSNRKIAWFLLCTSMLYIYMLTFINIPPDNVRFADTALGFVLGTILGTVVNFIFGAADVSSNNSYKNENNNGIDIKPNNDCVYPDLENK